MGKHSYGKYVVCPYYKDEDGQKLRCEGVGPGTVIHLAFTTKQALRDYRGQYCEGCWKNCMIAGALNRKYDYE